MIKTKKELNELLKYEKSKYDLSYSQSILGWFGLSERGVIWNYQRRLRKYEYYLNTNHRWLSAYYHLLVNRIGMKYGIRIEPNAVGRGMRICHLGSIIIRGHIGDDSVIHINTALVGGGTIDKPPKCGNNLYLSIGATIVGNVEIGDNVCIAAGAVVVTDVPNNVTVGGVPARIITPKGPLDW